ncbi:MAG: GNAT family N-acetyltransferase [Sphingomonadales bacterium]|nr:GNAT family N-acetyltransferase [Sphingomonadales bacterium]MDE2169624.1 GNAT family N-acetyltransferase [Sphingomonadales bacterium]
MAEPHDLTTPSRPAGRLSVRLARDAADLANVQRLRWQVFFTEMGAHAAHDAPTPGLDSDAYDALCDHLLVIDEDAAEETRVVGTYRLLRESVARQAGGFYSAGEFDLSPLIATADPTRELLELGRSCVLPTYRTSATIQLLWRGIADYIGQHRIGAMFGCASFPGTNPDDHAEALSFLAHNHLAPADRRPVVRDGVALERLPRGSYEDRRALFQLPPLVKGYLRVGAKFGDGAYIDHAFNTVDVCVLMPVEMIAGRYAARFSVAA